MAAYPRESSRCGALASLLAPFSSTPLSTASPQLSSLLPLLHLTSSPAPQRETVSQVGQLPLTEEHHSRVDLYKATHPSGHQSPLSHRTRCGFFPQHRPMAVASANGPQVLSSTFPRRVSGVQYCTSLGGTIHNEPELFPRKHRSLKLSNRDVQIPGGLWVLFETV